MKITIDRVNNTVTNVATQCPHCGHYGTFEAIQAESCVIDQNGLPIYYLGAKRCQNTNCRGQIFL